MRLAPSVAGSTARQPTRRGFDSAPNDAGESMQHQADPDDRQNPAHEQCARPDGRVRGERLGDGPQHHARSQQQATSRYLRRTVESTRVEPREKLDAHRHNEHHQETKYLDLAVDLHECRCTGREGQAEGEAKQQVQPQARIPRRRRAPG
jgi:hypothetical protein